MKENPSSPSQPSQSLGGHLLLASPALTDGVFDRSVIFIAHHSRTEGAFGVIFNQPSETCVAELVSELETSGIGHLPVFIGGPVSTKELTFSSLSIGPDGQLIHLPHISAENAASICHKKNCCVHATLGYSMWSPGQLESELAEDTWSVIKAQSSIIGKSHGKNLWSELMAEISPEHALLSEAPKNPLLN